MTPQAREYVDRAEFEERMERLENKFDVGFAGVTKQFAELTKKLDEREERRRPGLGIIIAAISGIGIPSACAIFAIVINMADTKTLQAWATSHAAFSESKANEFAAGISALREQQGRNVTKLDEQEMQHRWIADTFNLQTQRLEQMIRLQHPEIPASDYWPLSQIGQAQEGQ